MTFRPIYISAVSNGGYPCCPGLISLLIRAPSSPGSLESRRQSYELVHRGALITSSSSKGGGVSYRVLPACIFFPY
jgi:hypothetical protein